MHVVTTLCIGTSHAHRSVQSTNLDSASAPTTRMFRKVPDLIYCAAVMSATTKPLLLHPPESMHKKDDMRAHLNRQTSHQIPPRLSPLWHSEPETQRIRYALTISHHTWQALPKMSSGLDVANRMQSTSVASMRPISNALSDAWAAWSDSFS